MKKYILLFAMMLAFGTIGMKAQSVHKMYATPTKLSGQSNISWDKDNNKFTVTANTNSAYELFSFPAGTLSNFAKIHINIANKDNTQILFLAGNDVKKYWSFGSTGEKNSDLGTGTGGVGMSDDDIASITSIRFVGIGTISESVEIALTPSDTWLETESREGMDITTTITSSSTDSNPFQWTKDGDGDYTTPDNFGHAGLSGESGGNGCYFGYPSNNGLGVGYFNLTGYDRVNVTLNSFHATYENNSETKNADTGLRLLAGEGTQNTFSFNSENLSYTQPLTVTKCTSIKPGAGASNWQQASSIEFIKNFYSNSTTAFSIAASNNSTVNYDRSFTVGRVHTICLPFAATYSDIGGEEKGTYYKIKEVTDAGVVVFEKANYPEAYTPYLFVPAEGCSTTPFASVTKDIVASSGKTLQKTVSNSNAGGTWTFQGTLGKITDVASQHTGCNVYGWSSADGTFVKVGTGVSIDAFRAYIIAPSSYTPSSARLNVIFDDESESETTGIQSVNGSRFTVNGSEAMYNLSGQRVGKDYKGIVIQNGKKMIVK